MAGLENTSEKPNRMARRRLKTRQQLLEAAITLVLEKGFDETTTDAISEAADVGRRTFYNHFDNKRDCVLAAVKGRYSDYAAKAASPADRHNDPALALATTAAKVFNQITADPVTQQLIDYPRLLAEAVEESQREFLLQDFLEGLIQGRFNPSTSADMLQPILLWGFVGLVIETINQSKNGGQKIEANQGNAWANFVLYNLSIPQDEIDTLLQQVS